MRREISASQFKARCLGLMDEVAQGGEVLVITKNGKPVAELHPCRQERRSSPLGLHPETELIGDLMAPLDEPWDAQA
jgi:prevent-host-death family protein